MSTVFIGGAAFNLPLQLGALKWVMSQKQVKVFAGTSSGSTIAMAMALGWDLDDLCDYMGNSADLVSQQLQISYLRLLWTGALISNEGRQNFYSDIITNSPLYKSKFQGRDPISITFKELDLSSEFICNAICCETDDMRLLSKWTTPHESILKAVSASSSLPGLFQPTILSDGYSYIDAGLIFNFFTESFNPKSHLWYKNLFPNVDIPVDLNDSIGIMVKKKHETIKIVGPWSFKKLLTFYSTKIWAIITNITSDHNINVYENTLYLTTKNPWWKAPSSEKCIELFEEGYRQASVR